MNIDQKLHHFTATYQSTEAALDALMDILSQNPQEHTLTVTLARAAVVFFALPVYQGRYTQRIQHLQEQLVRFDMPLIEDADFCDMLPCFHLPVMACCICLKQLCAGHMYRHQDQAYCWSHHPLIHQSGRR